MGTADISGIYEDLGEPYPGETTAEERREISDTLQEPSACEDKTAALEALCRDLRERVTRLEEREDKRRVWAESVDTQLQELQNPQRQSAGTSLYAGPSHYKTPYPHYKGEHWHHQGVYPGYVTQKEFQEKEEENKKLKERVKDLEARNEELLSKVMSMHTHSEDMNDPACLSAVLQMYEKLRLHEWGKFRVHEWEKIRTNSSLIYEKGSMIIKRLFDACEKDTQQRKRSLFEVLGIPPCNEAMTNSNQGMMREIRSILRYSYYQNQPEFYSQIVMDSPVKAVWNIEDRKYLEHVDKKGHEYWRKPALLWPIIKCGEEVVVKGVVWDEK